MWKYFMLNVQFVIFPGLERLVEASITLYCVIHKNGAPSKRTNKRMNELVLSLCLKCSTVCRPAPVGDFQSSGRCESGGGGGGAGCDPHTTELFIVFSIPVFSPAAVAGAQGLIALFNVHGVQVSTQLEGYRTGPALPGHNLTGFHLRVRDRRA